VHVFSSQVCPALPTEPPNRLQTDRSGDAKSDTLGHNRIVILRDLAGMCSLPASVPNFSEGVIVDLGTPRDLTNKYQYWESIGDKQGFASIRLQNGSIVIAGPSGNPRTPTTRPLEEAATLVQASVSNRAAPIKLNHVYLIRQTDSKNPSTCLIVKLLVVEFRPGESVTFRWQIL